MPPSQFPREVTKPDIDYSEQLDKELPLFIAKAKANGGLNLAQAIDEVMDLEKKCRQASDLNSVTRILTTIVTLCKEAGDWDLLCSSMQTLSKRHAQLKGAVTKMVQLVMEFLDDTPTAEIKIQVIETIRLVTDGKLYVEVERARVTRQLSAIKKAQGNLEEAKNILCELQIETYGSMDRKEKTDYILLQVELCIEHGDYSKALVMSRKISTKWFNTKTSKEDPEIMALKLRYYEQQVQIAKQDRKHLDISGYYRDILDTPSIRDDPKKLKAAHDRIIYYLLLHPYDNLQIDLVHHIVANKDIAKITPETVELAKLFTLHELFPWARLEQRFGPTMRETEVFHPKDPLGPERWETLRKRVIELNIRVVDKYYTRLTMPRLCELLGLGYEETETYLSKLVVEKIVKARINRPGGTVVFGGKRPEEDTLNEWRVDMNSMLKKLDTVDHLINKEKMMAEINAKLYPKKSAKGKEAVEDSK